jgi:site-specific recombinase XerD
MAKFKIILDSKRKTADNKYPLRLSINNYYTSAVITLPYKLKECDWDKDIEKIKKSCTYYNAQVENVKLTDYKQQFEVFIINISQKENISNYTASELKQMFLKERDNKNSKPKDLFFPYFIEFMDLKKKENPHGSTYDIYKNTLIHLLHFTKNGALEKFEKDKDFINNCKDYLLKQTSGLKILDVNKDFINDFKDNYLSEKKCLSTNSISIQLRNIRSIFNYIKDEHELITEKEYPFNKIQIKSVKKPKSACLPVNDLVKLFTYEGTEAENKYINLFKLSFLFMGINFKDMLYLQKKSVQNGRINFERNKTGKSYSIKIVPEAKKIIDEYEGETLLLNILENKLKIAKEDRNTLVHKDIIRETNKKLKKVCEKLEISFENLSTNDARHAFASLALEAGVEWKVVQYCLGHEVGDTLNIYNHATNHLIDEAQELLLYYIYNYDKIKKKREVEKEKRKKKMLKQTIS